MKLRTTLAIGLASLVAVPAADATPRDIPVAEGKVEHRVRTMRVEASYPLPDSAARKIEEWTSRDRYHSRVTDAETGKLLAETFQTGSRLAIWDPKGGNWTGEGPRTRSGRATMIGHSFAEEAWLQRTQIFDKGWYHQTGETATTLEFVSDPDAPSDGDNTTTLVLNRDFTIVRRHTESRFADGGWFKQTEETLVQETLDNTAAPKSAFASAKAKVARKRSSKRARRG